MMLRPTFTCTNGPAGQIRLKNAVLKGEFEPLDHHYSEELRDFTMRCLDRDQHYGHKQASQRESNCRASELKYPKPREENGSQPMPR